jgi:hypothetical protein
MKSTKNLKFVNKLKELDVKPEVIAVALNKTADSVRRWKSGKHKPRLTPEETATLCDLLKVSIHELAEIFKSENTTTN